MAVPRRDERRGGLKQVVGQLARGKQLPSILVVEKLAAALGTTMSSMREVEKATDEK